MEDPGILANQKFISLQDFRSNAGKLGLAHPAGIKHIKPTCPNVSMLSA